MTTPHTHSEACLVIHASESAEGRQVVNRSLTPAMLVTLKQQLLERIEALSRAVKHARETANGVEAPEQALGGKLFEYLFA